MQSSLLLRTSRLTCAVALALASAACNQGDSGNVMAPDSAVLDPAQVDAALGPEIVTGDDNELVPANGAGAGDRRNPVEPTTVAEPTTDETVEEQQAQNVSGEQ